MGVTRRFRFGVVAESARTGAELIATARRAEALGYEALTLRDHFVTEPFGDQLAPMPALAAAASATERIRLGTLVLANDYRHPVLLAKEAATLDQLSGGRFELGLGAGWLRDEYNRAGLRFASAGERVARLEESLEIVGGLLAGETVTFTGDHYQVDGLTVFPRPERRPPILVGAGSPRMLRLAGRYADIAGILPRALPEGTISAEISERLPDTIARKADLVREAGRDVELSMLVSPVFGDDPYRVAADIAARRGWDVPADTVLRMPSQLIGPPEHMAGQIRDRRDRYGFTYYVVSDTDLEEFAPVVALLTGSRPEPRT